MTVRLHSQLRPSNLGIGAGLQRSWPEDDRELALVLRSEPLFAWVPLRARVAPVAAKTGVSIQVWSGEAVIDVSYRVSAGKYDQRYPNRSRSVELFTEP